MKQLSSLQGSIQANRPLSRSSNLSMAVHSVRWRRRDRIKLSQGFGPMLATFKTVPFNDPAALEDAIDDDVAAIMLEVIQGEGGIHAVSPSLLCHFGYLQVERDSMHRR